MKHKPKVMKPENILRSMLLNIRDNSVFTAEDYNLEPQIFNDYIEVLIKRELIYYSGELPITSSKNLIICDLEKFKEWTQGNLYYKITKYILPLWNATAAAVATAATILTMLPK